MAALPKFHHSRSLNLDLDTESFDSNPLLGVFLQVAVVLFAAALSWVYYFATRKTRSDEDTLHPDYTPNTTRFEGYRNFDEARDGAGMETIYPGNPSKWYGVVDVPYFRLAKLKEVGGGAEIRPNQRYLIAIADKVFDVTGGVKGIPHCPEGVDWSQLYGHDVNHCVINQDFTPDALTKPVNIESITPKQRKGFFAIYNHVYTNYPIVGLVEGGEKYLPLLKNASKFDRPNFFW